MSADQVAGASIRVGICALRLTTPRLLVGFQEPKTSVDANALFTKAREFMSKWGNLPAPSDKFPAGNRRKHGLMAAVPLLSFGDVMHRSPSQTPQESDCPVVVVGGSVVGLGVARSLAAARTSVVILDTSPLNAALWSRHCVGRVIASLSGKPLIDELKVLARSFTQPPFAGVDPRRGGGSGLAMARRA